MEGLEDSLIATLSTYGVQARVRMSRHTCSVHAPVHDSFFPMHMQNLELLQVLPELFAGESPM